MRVVVTGATGYIGGRLVTRLRSRGHAVRCFSRSPERLRGRFDDAVELAAGEVQDYDAALHALEGADATYYLVHSMSAAGDFRDEDRAAAQTFARAARDAGVKRIIYLGGLGDEGDRLSAHLRSRHEVGEVLAASGVPVIEFRAAQIVGSGSVSFEMVRYLCERLPVMIAPKWVGTRCQPIAVRDVLAYLVAALDIEAQSVVVEIGGADVLTYKEMMLRYAAIRGLRRRIVVVPFFSPRLSSYWIHIVTPIGARVARPLILGLRNEVVVRDDTAQRFFPDIVPLGFERAVRIALDRYRTLGPETTWFDAFDVRRLPGDFTGVREGMLIDRRMRKSSADSGSVWRVVTSLGGQTGWLSSGFLWELRGLLDRLSGGVGLRRGRRSETDLRLGDAVDFWRVDAIVPGRLLRLRAEMKLPGRAWIQFEIESKAHGTELRQTAFFEPRGLFGYLYWFTVAIFHEWVFARMAAAIVLKAEAEASKPMA